jgi:hypothetical protein
MKSDFWLDVVPLWGVFGITVVMVFLSIRMGAFLGYRKRHQPEHENESSFSTIIGATLGLLAFMLAFTFGIAADRFQTRKQLLLDEVNTIGTAYLRAELLLEPHRSEIRKLLREYVDIRVNFSREASFRQLEKFEEVLSRSEKLQGQLWSHVVAITATDRTSPIDALFISALNEVIDFHNSRVTVLQYHIPPLIWYVLFFITFLSMATVGYQAGLSGQSSVKMGIVLALTFSAVIFLIADLDRPTGILRVNQQPLFDLQKQMQNPTQETGYETTQDSKVIPGEKIAK